MLADDVRVLEYLLLALVLLYPIKTQLLLNSLFGWMCKKAPKSVADEQQQQPGKTHTAACVTHALQ